MAILLFLNFEKPTELTSLPDLTPNLTLFSASRYVYSDVVGLHLL